VTLEAKLRVNIPSHLLAGFGDHLLFFILRERDHGACHVSGRCSGDPDLYPRWEKELLELFDYLRDWLYFHSKLLSNKNLHTPTHDMLRRVRTTHAPAGA
jgi:hypothetical protein